MVVNDAASVFAVMLVGSAIANMLGPIEHLPPACISDV
jgi:hypothetical protein